MFLRPPDCPVKSCSALEKGRNELTRLVQAEDQLRAALAREESLLEQRDELIRHKDLMSGEADHRLINGLQMVSSLLLMQSRKTHNGEVAEQLNTAANRVATIGKVQKRLHALDRVPTVELKQYLADLCQDISGILSADTTEDRLVVEGPAIEVPTGVGIPVGYIVSELVTNCAKYAEGKITVSVGRHPAGGYELSVTDNGPGLPADFDPKKSTGLGMKIVASLVSQIGGQLRFRSNHDGRGARFTVLFQIDET